MPRSPHVRYRAVYRLVTEVVRLGGDAARWTDRLLDGARELFGAKMAGCGLCPLPNAPGEMLRADVTLQRGFTPDEMRAWTEGLWGEGNAIRSECLRRCAAIPSRFITVRRQDLMGDEEWYASEGFREVHAKVGVDGHLTSLLVVPGQRRIFGLAVHRPLGAPQFTVDDRRQFRRLHLELARAWRGSIVAPARADAAVESLPPRLREVLWLLCAGRGEKEIARELGVSPKTVHNHVVRLHQVFDVHSRGELLARVLGRALAGDAVALPDPTMNQFVEPT